MATENRGQYLKNSTKSFLKQKGNQFKIDFEKIKVALRQDLEEQKYSRWMRDEQLHR